MFHELQDDFGDLLDGVLNADPIVSVESFSALTWPDQSLNLVVSELHRLVREDVRRLQRKVFALVPGSDLSDSHPDVLVEVCDQAYRVVDGTRYCLVPIKRDRGYDGLVDADREEHVSGSRGGRAPMRRSPRVPSSNFEEILKSQIRLA